MNVNRFRRVAALLVVLIALSRGFAGSGVPVEAEAAPLPIIELRQYTLHPGKRDVLVDLFDTEFIESQEAVGMNVVGQFRDLDKPDRFVWIRAFKDMPSRAEALTAFYNGPVWQAHRSAANATIRDSDNVLLLHVARPDSGFMPDDSPRPPKGGARDTTPRGLIVATIYYFAAAVEPGFAEFFENAVRPHLNAAGIQVLASFVTETSPNNFPRLPVRDADHVFVWFARFADQTAYKEHQAALVRSAEWGGVADAIRSKLNALPEVLRLQPTPRSQLHN